MIPQVVADKRALSSVSSPAADREARRAAVARVFAAAVATRALVAVAAWAGTHFPRADKLTAVAADGHRFLYSPWRALDSLARWDTEFYLRIAGVGYPLRAPAPPYEAAFFPLYPALVRTVSEMSGLSLVAAGALVSIASFALALRAVFLLLEEVAGTERAAAATVALLAFPGTVFLTAVYTESLFLLLTATALLAARRRDFLLAGLSAALAALARPNGALVAIPVAIEALAALRRREPLLPGVLALALPVLAVGAHAALLGRVYGDPLAFMHVQAQWGRGLAPPWKALLAFSFDPEYYVVAIGGIAAIVWAARRLPLSLQVHGALAVVIPLCSGTLKSMPRFAGVAFPLFLAVERWTRSRRARLAYLAVALLLLGVYAFRFGRGDAIN